MKKYILLITMLFCCIAAPAQVLYTETFDNYNIGNLGTDPNGFIPGQGGWLTHCLYTKSNSFFNIVKETNRGKVLDLSTNLTKNNESFGLIKSNLDVLIDSRTQGNDVIKFEINFFTGNQMPIATGISRIRLLWKGMEPVARDYQILQFDILKKTGALVGFSAAANDMTQGDHFIPSQSTYLPFNTWIPFIVYLDYPNDKIYFELPHANKVFAGALIGNNVYRTSNDLIQDFKLVTLTMATNLQSNLNFNVFSNQRYDNIKITALKEVPSSVIALSTNEYLSNKFNLYPNPATTVVNISSAENMPVSKVAVYTIVGKLVKTQNFANETNIQLNTENLASGTYMLHIETAEGTAVKKLVKK